MHQCKVFTYRFYGNFHRFDLKTNTNLFQLIRCALDVASAEEAYGTAPFQGHQHGRVDGGIHLYKERFKELDETFKIFYWAVKPTFCLDAKEELGQGGYGKVCAGFMTVANRNVPVAFKKLTRDHEMYFSREGLVKELNHLFVVKFHAFYMENEIE